MNFWTKDRSLLLLVSIARRVLFYISTPFVVFCTQQPRGTHPADDASEHVTRRSEWTLNVRSDAHCPGKYTETNTDMIPPRLLMKQRITIKDAKGLIENIEFT
jgi:hypothetical protein